MRATGLCDGWEVIMTTADVEEPIPPYAGIVDVLSPYIQIETFKLFLRWITNKKGWDTYPPLAGIFDPLQFKESEG